MQSPITIGLLLTERRKLLPWVQRFVEKLNALPHVRVVFVDTEQPLASQGPWTVLFHSLSDRVCAQQRGNPSAECFMNELQQYLRTQPATLCLDEIAPLKTIACRYRTAVICRDHIATVGGFSMVPTVSAFINNRPQNSSSSDLI